MFSDGEAKPKVSFPFFFRFAAEGWGEEAREKCKEIFWFLHTRVRERVRGAQGESPRASRVRIGFAPPRTRRVRRSIASRLEKGSRKG